VIVAATKLLLLSAVLIQYAPLRVCAIEQVALGSSCHHAPESALAAHAIEQPTCGSKADPAHDCVCELAKVDGQHHAQAAKATLDWASLAVVPALVSTDTSVAPCSAADADPPSITPARLRPLLL